MDSLKNPITSVQKKWLPHRKTCSPNSANTQKEGQTSSRAGLVGMAKNFG